MSQNDQNNYSFSKNYLYVITQPFIIDESSESSNGYMKSLMNQTEKETPL